MTDDISDAGPEHWALGEIVLDGQPLSAVLSRIAELAALTVPGADEVSVTLIKGRRAHTVAFSGRLAPALDERQYADGFGPCMDAALTGRLITIEDTADSAAYPGFARQARRQGIRRTLSIGIPTGRETSGALNIYGAGSPGPFDQRARDIAITFARHAAVALLNASTHAAAVEEVLQLRRAMASRAGIEQAKGVIMHDRQCSANDAFDVLKDISSRTNRKIGDVALAVIEGRS